MIKKLLVFVCFWGHHSYSMGSGSMIALLNQAFNLNSSERRWEMDEKNIRITILAIEFIEAQKQSSRSDKENFGACIKHLTTCACQITGKEPKEVQESLEKELQERISEFKEASKPLPVTSGPSSWPLHI